MERIDEKRKVGKRLVLFPMPLQGHIRPMLNLATLLYLKGFSITIIQTHYNSVNPTNFPHFTFIFIEDGMPVSKEKVASSRSPFSVVSDLNTNCLEPFRDCLSWLLTGANGEETEPIACLISDALWLFTGTLADSFTLPRIVLRTASVFFFAAFYVIPLVSENSQFPILETRLEEAVQELAPLKLEDLPSEKYHEFLAAQVKETETWKGIIWNSFEELESCAVARVRRDLPIPIFLIGPLHIHSPASVAIPGAQGQKVISWLDSQAPNSVVYVSFGSLLTISKPDFVEIACGLAQSMQPFLWVVRSGSVQAVEEDDPLFPEGFLDNVCGRGHITKWVTQNEVLGHPAVGGFWTHCGWNSTLESISNGVPMICSPCFADQPINARLVTEGWNIGLQLEAGVKREDVVKAVRALMIEQEGEGMRNRARSLQKLAKRAVTEGGSSYNSLESLTSYLLSL